MSHINEALSLLRQTQSILKQAYQPMMDPAAGGGMPPGQPPMDPAMMQQGGGQPPMDPAMMQQAGGQPLMDPAMMQGQPPGPPPAPAIDPQTIMELMSAVQDMGNAMQSLFERVSAMEQEHKGMMKEFLSSRGEQKVLMQFLKDQIPPMGAEAAGVDPMSQMQGAVPQMMGGMGA